MARMDITNVDFSKIIPQFMRQDPFNLALVKLLNEYAAKLSSKVSLLSIWDQIDNMPEDWLDELAVEFDLDYYLSDADIETKRNFIKNALRIKGTRGTDWSALELFKSYFGSDSWLEQWYEYNGEPYTFRAFTTNELAENDALNKFLAAIKYSKNARSVLEDVFFYWRTPEHHLQLTHPNRNWKAGNFDHLRCGVKGGHVAKGWRPEFDLQVRSGFKLGTFSHYRTSMKTKTYRIPEVLKGEMKFKTSINAGNLEHPVCSKKLRACKGKLINESV